MRRGPLNTQEIKTKAVKHSKCVSSRHFNIIVVNGILEKSW